MQCYSTMYDDNLSIGHKAMVIKLTVSQTFGSFSSMRAGGVYFYYWHVFLMNIINYASARVQYLQQNLCEVGRIVNT